MLSAFTDPDLPPLLSPESQQPGLLSLAGAKFKGMKSMICMAIY